MPMITALRPLVPLTDTSPAQNTGSAAVAAGLGRQADAVAPVQNTPAVLQVAKTEAASAGLAQTQDDGIGEHARARIEAAQRAYMMTLRAAGLNPLNNPIP